MPLPKTIDQVIDRLETIIQYSKDHSDPLGLFAALYQKVTIRVKEGIASGRFENGPRMEKLDVVFANRYLEAYDNYQFKNSVTKSWQLAFDAAPQSGIIILQHLFLGMNAHINLDLGIAAAEVSPGEAIHDLESDFNEINQLLFELIEKVQEEISEVSPLVGLVDWVAKSRDEQLAKFSMRAARKHAWLVATRLAKAPAHQKTEIIEQTDQYVKRIGNLLLHPGWLVRSVNWLIGLFESKDVKRNIEVLARKT